MIKKLLLPVLCIALLAACKNSESKKDKAEENTANIDTMHHMTTPGGQVPELPAIPEGAKVEFKNLKDNATISSPFKLEMGVVNIKVDTAGPVVAGSGHHHLMIDAEDSLASGTTTPKDSVHIHFGKGQTEYMLNLSPGKHKLTLQFADGLHRSYGGQLSARVTVNVKK